MTKSQYVSLQEAADLAGKSAQTIRRLIKSNKLRYRKYKTPQGFTYLVERHSVMAHFSDPVDSDSLDGAELVEEFVPTPAVESAVPEAPPSQQPAYRIQDYAQTKGEPIKSKAPANGVGNDDSFQEVISQLILQHRDDKKRLFELLEMFQKRILTLEDQIKMLEAPKKKSWWSFGR